MPTPCSVTLTDRPYSVLPRAKNQTEQVEISKLWWGTAMNNGMLLNRSENFHTIQLMLLIWFFQCAPMNIPATQGSTYFICNNAHRFEYLFRLSNSFEKKIKCDRNNELEIAQPAHLMTKNNHDVAINKNVRTQHKQFMCVVAVLKKS